MYNIIQLNDKDLTELQQIAKELGLKKPVRYVKKNWYTAFWTNKQSSVLPRKRQLPSQTKNAKKGNLANAHASA